MRISGLVTFAATVLAWMALVPEAARAATDPCRDFPAVATSGAVGQPVQYTVTAGSAFARLDAKIRWSDGPDDAIVSLQPGESHTFIHTYSSAGSRSVFITASGPLAAGGSCSAFEHYLGMISIAVGGTPPPPPPPPPPEELPLELQDMLNGGKCQGLPLATPIGLPVRSGSARAAAQTRLQCDAAKLGAVAIDPPAPGHSTAVSSPKRIPVDASSTTTSVYSPEAYGSTPLVAQAKGRAKQKGSTRVTAESIIECWLIGPDVDEVSVGLDEQLAGELRQKFRDLGNPGKLTAAEVRLYLCIALAEIVLAKQSKERVVARAASGSSSCHTKRTALRVGRSRSGLITAIKRATSKSARPPSVRYTCALLSSKTMIIRAKGKGKGSLRNYVGPRMRLGAHRLQSAPPAAAKLQFAFGLRAV